MKWTKDELRALKHWWPKESIDLLMWFFPNHTWQAIKMRASRLGLKKKKSRK